LKFITKLPIAYIYASLLIDKRAFSKLSAQDQLVVREVMEGTYRKFDQNGARENGEAFQALLDNGLQVVEPDTSEVNEWRAIVNKSHRELANKGTFDAALLDQMQALIKTYRNGADVASN
jgi:TRAP-type C4-dicarboxylate transport system substrate-binding protein